jgi:secreted trypsin-like serine protease
LTSAEEAAALAGTVILQTLGWGALQEGGQTVRNLRVVDVPHVDRADCNRPLAYDGRITGNMVCAGKSGTDSCQGDSGGPLTAGAGAGLRPDGVVSWGDGCARPNKVGVYTRVVNYTGWIQACIAAPTSCP